MGKIYSNDQVEKRIELIVINEGNIQPSFKETILSPKYKYSTLVGCTLSVAQQLSVFSIVIFYSSIIMSSTGLPGNYITALIGLISCISSLPSMYVFQKFGRKPILWFQSFMMATSLIALGVTQIMNKDANSLLNILSIVFLAMYILFF